MWVFSGFSTAAAWIIGVVCFTLAAGRLGHAASIPPREEQGESCGPDGVHQRFQTYYMPVKTKWSSSAYRTVKFNIILNISSVFRTVGLVGSLCCGIYLQVLAQRWKMYRFWWVKPIFLCYLPRIPRVFCFPCESFGNLTVVQKLFLKKSSKIRKLT